MGDRPNLMVLRRQKKNDYSKNSRQINDAMLKAMKVTRNSYDDMPGAITEGNPNSSTTSSGNKRKSTSDSWSKKHQLMKEHEWVYK